MLFEIPSTEHLIRLTFSLEDNACVCVVLASDGYPLSYEKGFEITGMDKFHDDEGYFLFHAGTKFNEEGTKL